MNDDADLNELYQEILLDHARHPRHSAALSDDEVDVEEENPNCGDRIRLAVDVCEGRLVDLRYEARGCAISTASASIMSDRVCGMETAEARRWIERVVLFLQGRDPLPPEDLGDLAALAGVKRFPLRVKCATMAWHALSRALDRADKQTSS